MLDSQTITRNEQREIDAQIFARLCAQNGINSTTNNHAVSMALNFLIEATKRNEPLQDLIKHIHALEAEEGGDIDEFGALCDDLPERTHELESHYDDIFNAMAEAA